MEIKDLQKFAAEESARLHKNYLADTNQEVQALHALAKLLEESGELSEAVLKKFKTQRGSKLEAFTDDDLAGEIADVMVCLSIIAHVSEVNMDDALNKKVKQLVDRYDQNGEFKDGV